MRDRMPWDVKQQVLWIVRGHERSRREYAHLREEIFEASSGGNMQTYTVNGEERLAAMPATRNARRTTEDRQMQLEALEQTALARNFHAVEKAYARIGAGMPEKLRVELREAVRLNCQDGRKWPYERLHLTSASRSDFYRQRDAFFKKIAEEVGLWR